MKSTIVIAVTLCIAALSFSCTKNYNCGCAYDRVSGNDSLPERQKFELFDQKESYAKDYCAGQKATFETQSDLTNVDCVLSKTN